jgi:hypothetical protein
MVVLNTASSVISFAKALEDESSRIYEEFSEKYGEYGDTCLLFIKENKKNIVEIERSYYGVISDALEGCFAFNIDPEEYVIKIDLSDSAGDLDALSRVVVTEEIITKFYRDAAEQSRSLMADVPRTFMRIVKKRESRRQSLQALLDKQT